MPKFTRQLPMAKAHAYWISPMGKIIPVDDAHIARIVANPDEFDLDDKEVRQMFADRGEKIGQEGGVRGDLVRVLVSRGWMRLRLYRNMGWTVNMRSVNPRTADHLQGWAEGAIEAGHSRFEPVRLDPMNGSPQALTVGEVANGDIHSLIESVKVVHEGKVIDASRLPRQHKFLIKHLTESKHQYACFSEAYRQRIDTEDGNEFWKIENESFVRRPDGSILAFAEGRSYLLESSLSRLWQHAQNGFVIFTGFNSDLTKEQSQQTNAEIQKILREKGIGYIQVMGRYVETKDDGKKVPVVEESFFVPLKQKKEIWTDIEELIGFSIDLLKKIAPNQEAILWSDGKDIGAKYLTGKIVVYGKFNIADADKSYAAWTELRKWKEKPTGKGFVAENIGYGIRHRTRAIGTNDGCMMSDGSPGDQRWSTQEPRE